MGDLGLAELPAEEHRLPALRVPRREVEEPAVRILELHALGVDLLHEAGGAGGRAGGPLAQRADATVVDAAAVPRDRRLGCPQLLGKAGDHAPLLREPLGERPETRQGFVRLVRREEPHLDIVTAVVSPRPLLAALVALLAAAGCGERDEPLGDLEQRYPVTVQGAADRPAVATEQPQRVVALDAGAAELVLALGARERLVGVPAGMRRGDGPGEAPPDAQETTGGALQVRTDVIRRLEPDLIVASATTDLLDRTRIQRQTGAVLYVQPGSSVDDVLRATLEIGTLLGEPVEARRLAADIRARVAAVEERIAGEPAVTAFVDTGFFITVPRRSLLGDLLVRAGGESVAGPTPGPEPFPPARLRSLAPDVYLATSDSGVTLASLRSDPRVADLRAVRRERFAILPSALVNRAGPRIGQALERVAEALHPDAFR